VPRDSAPLSFVDANDQATGFTAELLREAARVGGFDVEIVINWWKVNNQAFKEGKLDALSNVTKTDSEYRNGNFTIAHASIHGVTYSHPDKPRLRRVADFRGKRIGAIPGTVAYANALLHPEWGAQLVSYPRSRASCRPRPGRMRRGPLHQHPEQQDRGRPGAPEGIRRRHHPRGPSRGPRGRQRHPRLAERGARHPQAQRDYDQLFAKWIGPVEPRAIHLTDLRPYFPRSPS